MTRIPVHFRKVKGDLLAVFPSQWDGPYLACYATIGQHSVASVDYVRGGRAATPEEYGPLLQKLTRIYAYPPADAVDLDVRKIFRPHFRKLFPLMKG